MSLEDYQSVFAKIVQKKITLKDAATELGVKASRLGVYEEAMLYYSRYALKKMYPRVLLQLTEIEQEALFETYYRLYGTGQWELNALSFEFVDFLKSLHSKSSTYGALSELATYERAEFQTYTHLANELEVIGSLNLKEMDLNPTLSLYTFEVDVCDWLYRIDKGKTKCEPRLFLTSQVVSFCRNPQDSMVRVTKLSSLALKILNFFLQEGPKSENDLLNDSSCAKQWFENGENWKDCISLELTALINQSVILRA